MKDIVIIANFCRDFSETDNGRFMYICKELSKTNRVEIITSDFSHSGKKHKQPLQHNWPFTITFLHEPGYKKNISLQRFKSHYRWGKEVKKYLEQREKPDVVYCAVPSLTAANEAGKYCEKNNIPFIIDIQDLWPEAFQMVFNVPVLSKIIFAPFKMLADGIYRKADMIIGVSNTYVSRAKKVNKKSTYNKTVFLGTELAVFDENAKNNPLTSCTDIGIPVPKPENEIWLAYCGTLGASYDLSVVFDAMRILNDDDLRFVVMGQGERMEEFKQKAEDLNVTFTGRLSYDRMCGVISACDITVNPIMPRAAASIINKHADYAASGLPVLNTQDSQEYRDLVEEYDMGLNCENGSAEDLAQKLKTLLDDKELRLKMGRNARRCAAEKFDRKNSYSEIFSCILG